MSDDLRKALFPEAGEPIDPVKMARRDLQKVLPRRFYKDVSVAGAEGGHALLLDGKPVRTPAKARLILPNADLAAMIAAEWQAQGDVIDPGEMPLTRLVNSAIDGVALRLIETVGEVAKFAETDLVCYRAGHPEGLVAAQATAWDPVLVFARDEFGARFICGQGVIYVEQPAAARTAVTKAIEAIAHGPSGALKLAALSVKTSLTGSVLLALAVACRHLTPEAAWSAAHVDDDYQARFWGIDSEAIARRARRWREMEAASLLYRLAE